MTKRAATLAITIFLVALTPALVAQNPALVAQNQPTATPAKPVTTPSQPAQKDATSETPQAPISKAQAKELFRSVDQIAWFVSRETDLPIDHNIRRTLVSREQVNRFLEKRFDSDEGTKRLERSEIVLKKFGLLDRDFQLQPFLISLLTEQIAGYYDDKTKTVNLLNWIGPNQQRPVLAHELTHALQDQSFDLQKWSNVETKGIATNVNEDNHHLELDEAETAREAVTEGQAMVVYVDYSLVPSGRSLADTPELGEKLKQISADTTGSPILARAPLLLQQSLIFPYSDGLVFEQAVLVHSGRDGAFAGVMENPPSSSYQIMNPRAYLAHKPVPLLVLPDIHPLIDPEYIPYDVGVMGELDVRILTELFGGPQQSAALTPAWRGGLYYAAQHRSATTPEQRSSPGSLSLLYLSAWQNADSARSFLRLYASALPRKYSTLTRRPAEELTADPASTTDTSADIDEQVYTTNEGDVLLSRTGSFVFVSEGYALPLARKLRESILAVQGSGPLEVVAQPALEQPTKELTLPLSQSLASMGMINAALVQPSLIQPAATRRYTLKR